MTTKQRIAEAAEAYTETDPRKVEVIKDPIVRHTYAVRMWLKSTAVDLLCYVDDEHGSIEFEECEFSCWPPFVRRW